MSSSKTKWNSLGDFLKEKEAREKEARAETPPPPAATPSAPAAIQPEEQSHAPAPPSQPPPHPAQETPSAASPAPYRDFNRRANSIEREALPQGLFPGSSKKLWDAVYFRTRGAIQPVRDIQATKRDLMQWSGIKNMKTVENHIKYFLTAGMMTRQGENGDRAGYRYGVIMLEEIPVPNPHHPHHHGRGGTHTIPPQKTGMVWDQKMGLVGVGNPLENKGTYGFPNTFLNTIEHDDDDEAFAALLRVLKQATIDLTGRRPTAAEAERWAEVAELLIAELKIAATRTTVSSVPAFLSEHLRRRLWKKDKKQLESEQGQTSEADFRPLTEEEKKSCTDCGGAGRYYPEGYDKGVKLCRHEKLREQLKAGAQTT